jgi:hypothetical protein
MADLATLQSYIADATERRRRAIENKQYYRTKMEEADSEIQSTDNEIYSYKQQVQYETDRLEQVIQEANNV